MPKKIINPAAALTLPEIEELIAQISDYRLTRGQIEADLEADRRALDERLLPIREEFRSAMERKAEVLHALAESIDSRREIVEAWARANMVERFGARRSLSLLHGIIGFRLSKPRLEVRPKRTFARAAWWLARLTWGRKYLRPATINKEAILKDRAAFQGRPERLRKLGLAIMQDDEFYLDCKETRDDALQPQKLKEAA